MESLFLVLLLNHLGDGKRSSGFTFCSGRLLNHLGDGKLLGEETESITNLLNHLGDGKRLRSNHVEHG